MIEFSREYELVVAGSRFWEEGAGGRGLGDGSVYGVNWDRVVALAAWHKISGSLFVFLRAWGVEVPPGVLADFEHVYFTNVAVNLKQMAELEKVALAMAQQDVALVLLKGAALLVEMYRDKGLRSMVDLDLLVREEQIDLAESILEGLGYRMSPSYKGSANIEHLRRHHHHYPALVSRDGSISIELHRHLVHPPTNPFYFNIEALWQRAVRREMGAATVLVPAPEDLVAHLGLHFFRDRRFHSQGALRHLCEIPALIVAYGAEFVPEKFVERVVEWNQAGAQYLTLFAAQQVYSLPGRDFAFARLKPAGFDSRAAERFVSQRILRSRDWVTISSYRPLTRPVQRLFPRSAEEGPGDHGDIGSRSLLRSWSRRWSQVLRIVGSLLAHPWEALQNHRLNRWMASIE